MPKKLSKELEDRIAKEYESGLSLREVAAKLRVSKTAVQRVAEDRGIMRVWKSLEGRTAKSYRPGSIMAKGPELRKLYEDDSGVTVYSLAEQYGCTASAIHRSLVAAGTEMRPPGGDKRSPNTRGLLGWARS